MPHYNIWVRAVDDDMWKAVNNRSEWLHEKLSEGQKGIVKSKAKPGTIDPMTGFEIDEFHISSPKILELHDSLYEPKVMEEKITQVKPGWKPCKHGSDPKFCKFAKPGKPCK